MDIKLKKKTREFHAHRRLAVSSILRRLCRDEMRTMNPHQRPDPWRRLSLMYSRTSAETKPVPGHRDSTSKLSARLSRMLPMLERWSDLMKNGGLKRLRENIRKDVRGDVLGNIRKDFLKNTRKDLLKNIHKEFQENFRKEFHKDMRRSLQSDIRKGLRRDLHKELHKELREEMRKETRRVKRRSLVYKNIPLTFTVQEEALGPARGPGGALRGVRTRALKSAGTRMESAGSVPEEDEAQAYIRESVARHFHEISGHEMGGIVDRVYKSLRHKLHVEKERRRR